jgi:hypothetical protein
MSTKPYRDPKYSGWPGPEPVVEPVQVDIEEAIEVAPKPKRKKAEASATGAGAGE